jgi:hypothetical protein
MTLLSAAYMAWQEALRKEFFASDQAGVPVVFYVDDEAAAEIAGRHGIATPLSEAVRYEVRQQERSNAFIRIENACAPHHNNSEPPPSLPLLAATVVAASRMASDGKIRKTNFYVPLARVLYGETASEDTKLVILQSADQIAGLWKQLDKWLRCTGGSYGLSTIATHPTYTRVGYPISQALIRRADRMILTQFFNRLEPSALQDQDYLLRALRAWAKRRGAGLSDRFIHALNDPDEEALVSRLVYRLASVWDGTVLDSKSGSRLIRLRLTLKSRPTSLGWIAQASDAVTSGQVHLGSRTLAFTHDYGSYYEGLDDLSVSLPTLDSGLRLQGEDSEGRSVTMAYHAADVVVFHDDPDAGCHVSRDSIVPFEEHILLVSEQVRSDIESVMTQAGPGWKRISGAPPGWSLYSNVRFTDGTELHKALHGRNAAAQVLRPASVHRLRLTGGLRLATNLARNVYLKGGEPGLLLATDPEGAREVEAFLDGRRQDPPFVATGFAIPLSQAQLAAGDHVILVDGEALRFTITDRLAGRAAPPGTGSVGHVVGATGTASPLVGVAPDGAAIRGADIPGTPSPPVLLARRGARQTVLIDYRGWVCDIPDPDPPQWLTEAGVDQIPYFFEVPDSGEWSGWLLQEFTSRWDIRPLGEPQAPDSATVSQSADADVWCDLVERAAVQRADKRWAAYVAAAREVRA